MWHDANELGGGDAWDQKIRRPIRDCDYFMPVIPATTERRKEGYFRREWRPGDTGIATKSLHTVTDAMIVALARSSMPPMCSAPGSRRTTAPLASRSASRR